MLKAATVQIHPPSRLRVSPVELTGSEKVRSISTISATVYVPSTTSEEIVVRTGSVVSLTETLSNAAASPGVTPVPTRELNRTWRVFHTIAVAERESETNEPNEPVFFTVFETRSVVVVVSQSSAVIISSLAA